MNEKIDDEQEELFPESVRKKGLFVSSGLSIVIIFYYIAFILDWVSKTPKDLSLSGLLLFLMASVLLFWVPWHKLGLSLKKFGPLEFERRLEGQSEEHVKDISELESRIQELENSCERLKTTSPSSQSAQVNTVSQASSTGAQSFSNGVRDYEAYKNLVVKFLSEYDRWSFSPLRIEKWGAKRPGYESLGDHANKLRSILRRLVAEGILETRVSDKGNTLYRIKN